MKMPYIDESKALMQLDRRRVLGVDARDHDVLLHGGSPAHQLGDQMTAYPQAAAIRADVHAVLNAMPVARPCAKLPEASETRDSRCIPRNHQGEAGADLRVVPRLAALGGQLNLRINGGGVADDLVVNR